MSGLEALPLHDAIVSRITLHWKERTLELDLLAFAERGASATPHKLKFTGVSNFHCPHTSPWSESFHINSANGSAGSYAIEMQSGDEIKVEAVGHSFEPAAS